MGKDKMKISKWDWVAYAFCLAVIVFFGYLYVKGTREGLSLDENLTHAQGVVVDDFYAIKTTKYFKYEFSVDGKIYRDGGRYFPSDSLLVGDTIKIVYDSSNPELGGTYRDYLSTRNNRPFVIPVLIGIVLLTWWRVSRKKT